MSQAWTAPDGRRAVVLLLNGPIPSPAAPRVIDRALTRPLCGVE